MAIAANLIFAGSLHTITDTFRLNEVLLTN